jgi:flagellar hook-length control protein FliK
VAGAPRPTPPETPAQQLAAPLAGLLQATEATLGSEPRAITVTLRPVELGRVEVRVETRADGGLAISLVAERPETLAMLQRDAAQLDRALAQAGIAMERSSLSFDLGGGNQQPQGQAQAQGNGTAGQGGHPGGNPDGQATQEQQAQRHATNRPGTDAAPPGTRPHGATTASDGRLDISI